jgi:hypothetical protein
MSEYFSCLVNMVSVHGAENLPRRRPWRLTQHSCALSSFLQTQLFGHRCVCWSWKRLCPGGEPRRIHRWIGVGVRFDTNIQIGGWYGWRIFKGRH